MLIDAAIVHPPAKEQTKFSPGGAKWVRWLRQRPNEVSYGKDYNCCRHRQEPEELSIRPPNPTLRNYFQSQVERQSVEKQ
jgi:hypothetical protein